MHVSGGHVEYRHRVEGIVKRFSTMLLLLASICLAKGDSAAATAELRRLCDIDFRNGVCMGVCEDGFSETLLYLRDSARFDRSEFSTLFLADSTRAKGIASYYVKTCEPCARIYTVRNRDVSCLEYHSAIRDFRNQFPGKIDSLRVGM